MMKKTDDKRGVLEEGIATTDRQGVFADGVDESRRGFLRTAGGAGAVSAVTSLGLGGLLVAPEAARADRRGPQPPLNPRRVEVFQIRLDAALTHLHEAFPRQVTNGDEERYGDKRASFHKCLPQDDLAEVDFDAFFDLQRALRTGDPADFPEIPLDIAADRKLADPQAAFSCDLMGTDGWSTQVPPAPRFDSAHMAAEIGEVYWQALTRDVAFSDFGSDGDIAAAVDDLNGFSDIRAPKDDGVITPGTLFRGGMPGDLVGPYISQFLWLPVPYGPSLIEQKYDVPAEHIDFMTSYDEWLAIQRGTAPIVSLEFDPRPRYIYNGRALSHYVHTDALFQAYFNAALIITGFGPDALDPGNPYQEGHPDSVNQAGFTTFGPPHLFAMVTQAARLGLEAAWFLKWVVHRRLRPEVFAGRIENQLRWLDNPSTGKDYGIHPDILGSTAVARVLEDYGNALLPQAYPEGSPTHPAYPAGHSTVGGACATVLKAFVNEDFEILDPVQATSSGDDLEPWLGEEPLVLGGEINKLATNISIGRCTAGVHYRSDGSGLNVGERVAIGMLQDYSRTYNESFDGFTLTKFDGERIRIAKGDVLPT